jgi:hypothetical protein
MNHCKHCRKEKPIEQFQGEKKQYKNCLDCRTSGRIWREKNKETVSLYNKTYNNNKKVNEEKTYIYARLYGSNNEWLRFESQAEAARELKLYTANINKVIKGHMQTTGSYEFKTEKAIENIEKIDWEQIKKDNNIENHCIGKPSQKRILHETIDNIVGKKCCTCKSWKALTEYNNDKNHWDKLRADCKDCIVNWRKENREKIQETNNNYNRRRLIIDPEYKLLKTLRSRVGSALKSQSAYKNKQLVELVGCDSGFLKGYLEAKFKDGMSWENHGEWHIDHIKPCSSFNLLDDEQQKLCFHYTNLQPLWDKENLSKGNKIDLDSQV